MTKIYIYCSILLFFLSGCATLDGIEKRYARINYSDGLKESEAVTICQKFLLSHPEGKQYILSSGYMQRGKVFKDKEYVLVKFPSKQLIPFTKDFEAKFGVCIDRKTGEVFYAGKTYVPVLSGPHDNRNYEEKTFAAEIIDQKFEAFKSR